MAHCLFMTLVLFAATAPASAVVNGLPLRTRTIARDQAGACSCLNWKHTYEQGMISCGRGNEYFFASQTFTPSSHLLEIEPLLFGEEFCEGLFQHIDDSQCVNINMGADHGEWCYVSSDCPRLELNGGALINGTELSWKNCAQGSDRMLRENSPEHVRDFAVSNDLDLGILHKFAYPLNANLWSTVQAFWGMGDESPESMPAELRQEMQDIVSRGEPVSFDMSDDHHPPHRIVVGNKVYGVNWSPLAQEMSPLYPEHRGTWQVLTCEHGCV